MKDIIALLYPGCIFFELALATELLSKKYNIRYVTPDGSDHLANNGMVLTAYSSFKDVKLNNVAAILVPGGNFDSVKDDLDSDRLLKDAYDQKIWIAAICGGPFLLGKAGILKDKKIAHGFSADQLLFLAPYFEDVTFTKEKWISDQNIFTARPEAHIDFAVELSARLLAVNPVDVTQTKEYYRGGVPKIRPISLGVFENNQGQYLFHQGFDRKKQEYFYRPLGGGIDFGETGSVTLHREIQEELGLEVSVGNLLATYENIFTFEERLGHELVMVYRGEFLDKNTYTKRELDIFESGHVIAKAVWRSIAEIEKEGANIYPLGLEDLIKNL